MEQCTFSSGHVTDVWQNETPTEQKPLMLKMKLLCRQRCGCLSESASTQATTCAGLPHTCSASQAGAQSANYLFPMLPMNVCHLRLPC